MQLSWDLHVHPGPSSVPRWGTGIEIQAACARAGIAGFVWKSHDGHTARAAAALPKDGPRAIGSASLNAWATPDNVRKALDDGALWVWGPTYLEGHVGWDLPLPVQWEAFKAVLGVIRHPIVLATGHLGAEGRRSFAEFAAPFAHVTCSVTHSLYLDDAEVDLLRGFGCLFEVDLYTSTRAIHGRPRTALAKGIRALLDANAEVYLTSDCGQVDVGDPYLFSRETLDALAHEMGAETVTAVAVTNPWRLAERILAGTLP
ncbi:MAG TPA: DUF6282 family protein [Bauldia sp.]|nr:DUF6282 family protein [Bauldia sp.]